MKMPKLIFGPGKISELSVLAGTYGRKVLILTGGKSFVSTPHWDRLQAELVDLRMPFYLARVHREPSPERVDQIVEDHRQKDIELVIAIGGGSVLDAGKAVAAMFLEGGQVKSYLEGVGHQKPKGKSLPFIAVPTTAGTGSENTHNAVLSEIGPNGFKKSLRHPAYLPDACLIDPALATSCPAHITAQSGMDAFTQLLEANLSTKSNAYSAAMSTSGLEGVAKSLIRAYEEPDNLEARTGMAYAAFQSGGALAQAGLGVVHGMASAIGARFDIPHGLICGRLMGPANRISLQKALTNTEWVESLNRYTYVGQIFSSEHSKSPKWYAQYLIELIESWQDQLSLKRLGDYGMKSTDIPAILSASSQKNHPIPLNQEEMTELLAAAI